MIQLSTQAQSPGSPTATRARGPEPSDRAVVARDARGADTYRSPGAGTSPWWKNAVFYQIYPRSFQDTNSDGIGDLRGITARLDYLRDLGVDAIWITPFYPSPQVDFGYDVSDYVGVDPQFGSLEDFDRLIESAHARGIKVIVDLVPNHTSDQHPWFVESRASRESPKRDWYVWKDPDPKTGGPPNNWSSYFGPTAWTLDPPTGQYYLHQFYPQQPDLNWRNPEVERAVFDAVRTWLKRGVDGFRIDAVNHLFEDEQLRDNPVLEQSRDGSEERAQVPKYTCNLPEVHDVLKRLRSVVEEFGDDKVLITEAYVPALEDLAEYYADGDEIHLPFNFFLSKIEKLDAGLFRDQIDEIQRVLKDRPTTNVFSNHDMKRAVDRFGGRQHNEPISKMIAAMLATLPGTPFFYYGEELGMVNTEPKRIEDVQDPVGRRYWPVNKGRDGTRTPMQWSGEKNAGFSDVKPWLPVPRSAAKRNVEAESGDPRSILRFVQRAIALRHGRSALREGSYSSVGRDPSVFAYRRASADESLLVAVNMSPKRRVFTVEGGETSRGQVLLGSRRRPGQRLNTRRIELAPFESVIIEEERPAARASR